MAFQTFKPNQPSEPLDAFERDVARRKQSIGPEANIPRNSGKRRTESKKALLKAIEDAGGRW